MGIASETAPQSANQKLLEMSADVEEAEASLLAACILSSEVAEEVVQLVDASDFCKPRHKLIFESVKTLVDGGEDVNHLSLAEDLQHQGKLEQVGGRCAIVEICSNMLALSGWRGQVREVKRAAMARKLIYAAARLTGLATDAPDDPAELADRAAAIVDEACAASRATSCVTALEACRAAKASTLHNVVECGFAELDELGFCRRGALTVLGGETGIGKTGFCVEGAFLAAAAYGTRSAVISLEDDLPGIGSRLAALAMQASDDPESVLSDLPVSILSGDGLTVQQIVARLNHVKRAQGLDLVFIDSLQCIVPARATGSTAEGWRAQVEVARQLRTAARQLEVALVVTSQLARTAQKRSSVHAITDLRDSGSIEQDAAVVAMLEPHRKVRVCKNRYGAEECVSI